MSIQTETRASPAPGRWPAMDSPRKLTNGHSPNPVQPEKRRRIGKDSSSHGPTSEVALVDVDLVVFGRFEIKPWYPSPYVLDPLEYRHATSAHPPQSSSEVSKKIKSRHPTTTLTLASSPPHIPIDHERPPGRSPTPDSLSSLGTGSAPSDSPHKQHHSTKNHYPPSSQSYPPSSTSDLPPIASSQLLLPPACSNNGFNQSDSIASPSLKLYVCDGCLKYLVSPESYYQHKIQCTVTHPPGRKVYQSGNVIIREIDGSKAKLYCQCLCLFGKLFIDHKYIFFDVEGFKFYVLTIEETSPTATMRQKKESIMGFFSKEKISYDGYNLACIVTLPPYQKKGYGTLLIAFSYELDRFEAKDENGLPSQESLYLGTPERPLSTLGAKGYLSFWTAVLVRFFRTLFPPPPPRIGDDFKHPSAATNGPSDGQTFNSSPSMMIEMTLEEISRSTRLRPDDAAFALISSGLTKFKQKKVIPNPSTRNPRASSQIGPPTIGDTPNEEYGESDDEVIIITRDLVEQVAQRANVKHAVLDPRHVLINYSNYNHHHHSPRSLASYDSGSEDRSIPPSPS